MDKEEVIYVCVCMWECVCVCVYVCMYTYIYMNITQPRKMNEMMSFAGTWMDLEIIILSEISQTEKDKYYMISLICGI